MGQPSSGATPVEKSLEDRLDSWKEIAAYLNRDVTTVQRWEKREGMPVHRHLHDKMGSVYASRTELDAWTRSRNLRAAQDNAFDSRSFEPPAPSTVPPNPLFKRWKFLLLLATTAALAIGAGFCLQRTEHFWRSPLANAQFQTVTSFGDVNQAAAISRDGHFIAFLSNREGRPDVWVTQVGTGEFHNLTRGVAQELENPSIRSLGFSPDGSLVTFWVRKQNASGGSDISIWAVPTLGGEPRPYLEGAAEYDWSRDGSRLVYHTPGPGDPLFISNGNLRSAGPPIFSAPTGLHAHFPLWSSDAAFIYFVQGSLPDNLDIWRISSAGGAPERITSHNARLSDPVFLDHRTLLYLATDSDGSGPWLYSMDVQLRIPHRLASGPQPYTSLAASADGHRLVATVANPKTTLWRLPIADPQTKAAEPTPIPLNTGTGFSPRLGSNFLLYVSATGKGESIWKLTSGTSSELWRSDEAQIIGAPAISPDGQRFAFSVNQHGKTPLYVIHSDGSNAHIITDTLHLEGAPAWAPDGQSITSAVVDRGVPHLLRIPVDGRPPTTFVQDYSVDPAWIPEGRFAVYSGPDIGTTFSVKAVTAQATPYPLRTLTLTRGARHLAFLPGGHMLVFMRGDIQHKDLWLIDLDSGAERQLTNLPPDFDLRDFDISPDGQELVLERVQERSDVVLLDIPRP